MEAARVSGGKRSHPRVRAWGRHEPRGRDLRQDEPGCIEAVARLELWVVGIGQPIEVDRRLGLLERCRDRLLLAQAAVEPDRKATRHVVVDRAAHAHDAVDVAAQGLGDRRRVAGVQHDEPDLGSHRTERACDRLGRHQLAATVRAVEYHATRLVRGGRGGDEIPTLRPIRGRGRPRAVSAEVNDGGLQLAQFAQQIKRLGRPPGHEVEPVPVAGALQLDVDRARLLVRTYGFSTSRT